LDILGVVERLLGLAERIITASLILYHGTDADSVRGYKNYKGIYLSADSRYAKRFGKNVFKVEADINNPLIIELPNKFGFYGAFVLDGKIRFYRELTIEDINVLKNFGYDGIIVYAKGLPSGESYEQPLEVVVFDRSQIKVLEMIEKE